MEERKQRKIIMFPLPFPGHFNPMMQLASLFHNLGFSITIIHTAFNSPEPSHYPHFTFRTIHHNNEGEEQDPLSQPGIDIIAFIRQMIQSYAEPFRQALAEEVCGGETVSCLISDVVWAEFTTDVVGVRTLVLITSGAASFCAFAAYPLLRDKNYLPLKDSRLDEPVIELPPLKVKDLPVYETSEPKELYRIVNNMVKGAKSSSGVIWNTFEDLERLSLLDLSSTLQVPFFPIGPFHKCSKDLPLATTNNKEDHETTEWLNKQDQKSVVYVSFGSLADIEENEFLEIARGLNNCENPFLWVVRPGMVRGTKWLESLPNALVDNIGSKGRIVKWVNQVELLAHPAVGAFWTHCGWNSTLESIYEGVPMICTPCFADQRVNARYIVDVWRVGMMLERSKIDRNEVNKVIRSVMVEEGDGIKEICLKLKEKANACLSKDGSSSKHLV